MSPKRKEDAVKDVGAGPFRKAVREFFDAYATTWRAGDIDSWIDLWDEDAVQMPPDTPMRRGKALIGAEARKGFEGLQYDTFVVDVEEATVDGVYGYALGNYRYSFIRKETGARTEREGKYLSVFRRQADGSWKLCRDCFNLNSPAR